MMARLMRYANIENADLNLLLGLQALMEERSVTRAARRMFLSQPAMSRVLDRLQGMFQDELLVRTTNGYEPTKRAMAAYAELNGLLPRIEQLLRRTEFNAAEATDRLRIAASPYASVWLMPRVIALLAKRAPRVGVEVSSQVNAFDRLEANQVDLLLSSQAAPRGLRTTELFEEPYMCLLRRNHPLSGSRLTLRRYLAAPHISGHQPLLDERLQRLGYKRDVRVRLADPFSVGLLVERTDLIATQALRTAYHLQRLSKITMVAAPPQVGKFKYAQIWHSRNDTEPVHQWLRTLVQDAAAGESTQARRAQE
jgi:DNA-binding transcriptional LysR family regulator